MKRKRSVVKSLKIALKSQIKTKNKTYKKKPDRMTKRQHPEWELQVGINFWFKNLYPQYLLFSCSNEAAAMRAGRYRASGMLPGAPDLIMVLKDKVIFLELKAPKGRQSDAQVAFQHKSELLGIEYHIIRDLTDLKEILRNNVPLNEWKDL